ncbi:MAG: RNA-binding transcriptional accessory protein [Bacteroidales bacterium]|nr:RNA-binding transcriptional accessory protein [Bacteroidales bacterium]
MEKYIDILASELSISDWQVRNVLNLLTEKATIPFIARYRKEATGSLDETVITRIRDDYNKLIELDKRREAILRSIEDQGKLDKQLEDQINNAQTLSELEDLYLPFKPKRKTRASIAKEKGLEPLAKIIMAQQVRDVRAEAERYINPEKKVNTEEEALAGARDIIAEWINENRFIRNKLRHLFVRESSINSKVVKSKKEEAEKYTNYFDWNEPLFRSPSHRILAMFRGEKEGLLKVNIDVDEEIALDIIYDKFVYGNNEASEEVEKAGADCFKRLLKPSLENEVRAQVKEKADKKAIEIFTQNLRQLLMAAPLGQKNVLALDPGFRTGCKVVCLDRQGKLLHNETIYPHPPQREIKQAAQKIKHLVDAYKIEAIAIGNGTAGRETEEFIKRMRFHKDLIAVMVDESGASVYSASPLAREEFPEYDVTVRGAVSIGRRLMDPLAELVKIEPKSIGVGQYQHDVDQGELAKSLTDTVESSVNSVGVELNTASKQLLSCVSGVGPVLAGNIIEYRNQNGAFNSMEELKKVKRFGDKVFEQASGFLRVRISDNPLDRSGVHPESYHIVYQMANNLGCNTEELIKNESLRKQINIKEYVADTVGLPTLQDILEELAKPGRDPREKFGFFEFEKNIHSIEDLRPGQVLPGIITNITAFGAFVDIGIHENGLIHVSQMADEFVKDPNEYVKLHQKLKVKIVEVDIARKRIQLSLKDIEND